MPPGGPGHSTEVSVRTLLAGAGQSTANPAVQGGAEAEVVETTAEKAISIRQTVASSEGGNEPGEKFTADTGASASDASSPAAGTSSTPHSSGSTTGMFVTPRVPTKFTPPQGFAPPGATQAPNLPKASGMTLPGNSAASSGSARDNSAFIGSSSSSPSALPPLPDYPPRAIKRTWTGCNEDGDDEEEDEDNNPFALLPPPKDREAVLHPDILIHLVSNKEGQRQGLKKSLTESQLSLLAKDFLTEHSTGGTAASPATKGSVGKRSRRAATLPSIPVWVKSTST